MAMLGVVAVAALIAAATSSGTHGSAEELVRATSGIVVPEARGVAPVSDEVTGEMAAFEASIMPGGVKTEQQTAAADATVPESSVFFSTAGGPASAAPKAAAAPSITTATQQTLSQARVPGTAAPAASGAQLDATKVAPRVAEVQENQVTPLERPPQTQQGSAARDDAKGAVSSLQQFEQDRQKVMQSSGYEKAGPQPVVITGAATPSVEVATTMLTHKASASDDDDSIDVEDTEKSAERASQSAVDDLSSFEKVVSSTPDPTQQQTVVMPVPVNQGGQQVQGQQGAVPQPVVASAAQQSGASTEKRSQGEKNLLLAKGVVAWMEPDFHSSSCDQDYERQLCGHLACMNKTCVHCKVDDDCHSPRYRCFANNANGQNSAENTATRKPCIGDDCICDHKMFFPIVDADIEAMVLALIATMLAASGGIGGGGLLVPLFILVEDFEADLASPLSSATITGGAIVGYSLYCRRWHPLYPAVQRPLVDYETVLMILPSLLTGTMIGTIFDKILPLWFIMSMLFMLLGFSTFRMCQKAVQNLEKESNEPQFIQQEFDPATCDYTPHPLENEVKIEGTRFPLYIIALIAAFWVFVFCISLLKGGGHAQPSILSFVRCNNQAFWILQVFCWVAMLVVFIFVRDQIVFHGEGGLDGDVVWTPTNSITLPMMCLPCGIAAGLLGVGGGMVVGPLLIELGARPSTVSATSTFTILVTASSSAVQFVLMGKLPVFYALFFALIGGIGTFIGQLAVERIIKRYRSTSIIVFGISAVVCVSTLAMGYTGMRSIVRIMQTGGNMGLRNLCD
jgi:uncharacterized membrane protein YfcA